MPSNGSSPLTRGKPEAARIVPSVVRLIPAHAGKTALKGERDPIERAHPRSRGENSGARGGDKVGAGSSPLTRGKPSARAISPGTNGLIPAHAGKTGEGALLQGRRWAHPRSRGENYCASSPPLTTRGSSPLTRGKQQASIDAKAAERLIPAHAGKTPWIELDPAAPAAHPRSRGENARPEFERSRAVGSSPLTRGKLLVGFGVSESWGLIPAHAGKTLCFTGWTRGGLAHPRSRGENIQGFINGIKSMGSSPLTRGKHQGRRERRRRVGLIPAHAGKTLRKVLQRQHLGAHPRSRGENEMKP